MNFSTIISLIALAVSLTTAWLTLLRRGTVKMTQPTIIAFCSDNGQDPPKVFLRTLLYSTSKRGQLIENMYVKLKRGESQQNFSTWAYDDEGHIARGSGLYVGENGVAMNHHFLMPKDGSSYSFLPGTYILSVYVSLVNRKKDLLIGTCSVHLTQEQATAINDQKAGVYFDWGPDLKDYQSHLDFHPKKEILE